MRTLSFIFFFAIIVFVLADAIEVKPEYNDEEDFHALETADTSRFLAQRTRIFSTRCNKNPRICRVRGSPGADCCKRRCVDTTKDRMNCGICGHKCRYSEMCCGGRCVNTMKDKRNCGACNTRCRKGSKCTYGMCSYA